MLRIRNISQSPQIFRQGDGELVEIAPGDVAPVDLPRDDPVVSARERAQLIRLSEKRKLTPPVGDTPSA